MPHLGKKICWLRGKTTGYRVVFGPKLIYRFLYKYRKLKPVINLIEKTVPFTRYNNSKGRKKICFVKTDCGQCCIPLFWCSRFMEVTINFSRKWTFGHISYVRTSTNTLYFSTVWWRVERVGPRLDSLLFRPFHHTVKKLSIFPSPVGMSLTKFSPAGNNIPGQGKFG